MNTEARSLTLYEIKSELAELIAVQEQAEDCLKDAPLYDRLTEDDKKELQAELDRCNEAIRLYLHEERHKTDNIIRYIAEQEASAEAARSEALRLTRVADVRDNRAKRVKDMCLGIMLAFGEKRLEGRLGSLIVKGNGGVQALDVTDVDSVPNPLCDYQGYIEGSLWLAIRGACPWIDELLDSVRMTRVVNQSRVRKALAAAAVQGVELKPRGVHLEIR